MKVKVMKESYYSIVFIMQRDNDYEIPDSLLFHLYTGKLTDINLNADISASHFLILE